jgi:hypothetical protein
LTKFKGFGKYAYKKQKPGYHLRNFLDTNHPLDVLASKKFVLGIVAIAIIIAGVGLYQTPLFHGTAPNPAYLSQQDPLKFLYADCVPSISSWQVQLVTFVSNSGCANNGNFGNILRLGENSTHPAIAVDQTPMDLSTAASKVLEHDMTFAVSGSANFPTLDFYVTSNKTRPSGTGYDPFNDKSVVYLTKIQEPGGTSVFIHEYLQKDATVSIGAQAFDCPSGGTVGSTIACWTYSGSIPTLQLLEVDTRLNFTGQTGTQSTSSFIFQKCPTVPCTVLSSTSIQALPNFQLTGNYYLGIFASAQSGLPNMDVYGSIDPPNTNPYDVNNQNSMSFAIYTPNPSASQPPPFIDSGGFFGPVIRALIGIGVYMLANIIGFGNYLGSIMGPVWTFLGNLATTILNGISGVIVILLNALGSLIGDPNLGTQLISVFTQIGSYITALFTDINNIIGNLITFIVDSFNFLFDGVNGLLTYWIGTVLFGILGVLVTLSSIIVTVLKVFQVGFPFVVLADLLWLISESIDNGTEGAMKWWAPHEILIVNVGKLMFILVETLSTFVYQTIVEIEGGAADIKPEIAGFSV